MSNEIQSPRDEIDEFSRTWVAIHAWTEAQLGKAREDNDSLLRDENQTAALRGRIKLLKELIDLPKPDKRERVKPPPEHDEY